VPNNPGGAPRPLPERPDLRHLKDQAKALLTAGGAQSLADAQIRIAQSYGYASWPKLKAHVDSLQDVGRLKEAIDANDFDQVRSLMSQRPALHEAPLGRNKNGPLTQVAENRMPGPPAPERLAMAKWMIENGSDVHRGGDAPLMRAALRGDRVPMMALLVEHGADVNAECGGDYPILWSPCETIDPVAMQWLLEKGADPNCPKPGRMTTALDYLFGAYGRSADLGTCIGLLRRAGGRTRYDLPGVIDTMTDRADQLAAQLDADPSLVHRRFPELTFGNSGLRRLQLQGATLLHVAAEYRSMECAKRLVARGAQVNAPALVNRNGVGGQTAIFHAVTQGDERGLQMVDFLLAHGADLSLRVKLPGHYERLDEFLDGTPLDYAIAFSGPDVPNDNATVRRLREAGGEL
jgi:ankyrin repeat protein